MDFPNFSLLKILFQDYPLFINPFSFINQEYKFFNKLQLFQFLLKSKDKKKIFLIIKNKNSFVYITTGN